MPDDVTGTVEAVPRLALRPREAAQALGVSERTLLTWMKAGQIPFTKINGAVLFSVDVLREWVRRQIEGDGQ